MGDRTILVNNEYRHNEKFRQYVDKYVKNRGNYCSGSTESRACETGGIVLYGGINMK